MIERRSKTLLEDIRRADAVDSLDGYQLGIERLRELRDLIATPSVKPPPTLAGLPAKVRELVLMLRQGSTAEKLQALKALDLRGGPDVVPFILEALGDSANGAGRVDAAHKPENCKSSQVCSGLDPSLIDIPEFTDPIVFCATCSGETYSSVIGGQSGVKAAL